MLRLLKTDAIDWEIDDKFDEAPAKVPVRRHRYITTSRIGHATPAGRAEFAAAKLAGELEVKATLASVCREFGSYPAAVKAALAKLQGNNHSVAEKPIDAVWRLAPQTDREIFIVANANEILDAVDRITAP